MESESINRPYKVAKQYSRNQAHQLEEKLHMHYLLNNELRRGQKGKQN